MELSSSGLEDRAAENLVGVICASTSVVAASLATAAGRSPAAVRRFGETARRNCRCRGRSSLPAPQCPQRGTKRCGESGRPGLSGRRPRAGAAEAGSGRRPEFRLGSARLGSARLGSARLGSARLGSALNLPRPCTPANARPLPSAMPRAAGMPRAVPASDPFRLAILIQRECTALPREPVVPTRTRSPRTGPQGCGLPCKPILQRTK